MTEREPLAGPEAVRVAMTNCAVMRVGLATTTLLTVTPAPETATVEPAAKFVPVIAMDTVAPGAPNAGVIAVAAGAGGVIVNAADVADPPTVIDRAPAAAPIAIVSCAVICVALTTTALLTVTPAPETATAAPDAKLEPLIVTGTVAP